MKATDSFDLKRPINNTLTLGQVVEVLLELHFGFE